MDPVGSPASRPLRLLSPPPTSTPSSDARTSTQAHNSAGPTSSNNSGALHIAGEAQMQTGPATDLESSPHSSQTTTPRPPILSRAPTAQLGDNLLRDYALHIDPLSSHSGHAQFDLDEARSAPGTGVTPPEYLRENDFAPLPPPKIFPSRSSAKTFLNHRKNALSIDSIPRQTIMKAVLSRPPPPSQNLSISSQISSLLANSNGSEDGTTGSSNRPNPLTARRLSQALSELQLNSPNGSTPSAAKFAALASPCFFHKRFDDAVNIEKVLEEIQGDEWLSHSRLMQTATSVREVSKQLARRPIKRAVRNVMIVTKARDNHLVTLTRELAEWLLSTPRYGSDLGVNVYVDAKLKKSKRFDVPGLLRKEPRFENMLRYWTPDLCWTAPEKFDLVLTLGGDGTVLFTSWLFQRIVPPILSFSLGSLGFLTNFQFDEFKQALNKVMGDSGMRINLRMRFTCTVYRNPHNLSSRHRSNTSTSLASSMTNSTTSVSAPSPADDHIEAEQFEVLNEVVIDRGPSPYVSNLELFGDNNLLTVVQADGCIFSTPTGSTAYSLSAGGSLVHPDIPAILLTPICPHTLSFRPMLLNDSMLLRVAVPANSRATAYCSFDGKGRVELKQGDYVTIAASQYPFPTVLSTPTEWFDSIARTLRWNMRGAQQKGWDGAVEEQEEEGKEPEFDIDFEDLDEGYGTNGGESSAGGSGSPAGLMPSAGLNGPARKGMVFGF